MTQYQNKNITKLMDRKESFPSSYGLVSGESFCNYLKEGLMESKGKDSRLVYDKNMKKVALQPIGWQYHVPEDDQCVS